MRPQSTAPAASARRRWFVVAVLLGALGVVAACGSSTSTGSDAGPGSGPRGSITVFAAASLTEAFGELAEAFEDAEPDVSVTTSFAASSTLARQIQEGAPADVFASADEVTMQQVVDAGEVRGEPVVFATNSLEILVAPGNPEGITGLADLGSPGLLYVTAAPEVPIGTYATRALRAAGVEADPVSLEVDVKAVVTKVTSGEADAAIVYATDVAAAGGRAEGITIPEEVDVVATYPMALTTGAANPGAARAWIGFVTGLRGREILVRYGFGAP